MQLKIIVYTCTMQLSIVYDIQINIFVHQYSISNIEGGSSQSVYDQIAIGWH